jgi:hypothetical protein
MEVTDIYGSKLVFFDNIKTTNSTIEVYNVIRNKSVYYVRYYLHVDQLCDYNGIVAEDVWFMDLRQQLSNLYIQKHNQMLHRYVNKLVYISNVLYNIEYCKDIMQVIFSYVVLFIPEQHYMTTI